METKPTRRQQRQQNPCKKAANYAASITSRAGTDFARIGSNKKYAAIHHLGGQAGRGKKLTLPARPYLPISGKANSDVVRGQYSRHRSKSTFQRRMTNKKTGKSAPFNLLHSVQQSFKTTIPPYPTISKFIPNISPPCLFISLGFKPIRRQAAAALIIQSIGSWAA